jgi:hypothetical protein
MWALRMPGLIYRTNDRIGGMVIPYVDVTRTCMSDIDTSKPHMFCIVCQWVRLSPLFGARVIKVPFYQRTDGKAEEGSVVERVKNCL